MVHPKTGHYPKRLPRLGLWGETSGRASRQAAAILFAARIARTVSDTVQIPDYLLTQIREGNAVLVLGAGASRAARDKNGLEPPDGPALARLLSARFLGNKFLDAPLNQVSEYAISEASLTDVQEYIRQIFAPFEPAEFHKLIPTFRWFGLATTNYDHVVEKAYAQQPDRLQELQPIISNADRLQDALRMPGSVALLKLHGCISQTANPSCPLILTTDQYVQYRAGRSRLFTNVQEWAYERPLVFVGHSIQDPDIRAILLEVASLGDNRARSYGVMPRADDVVKRHWESKKLTLIDATAEEFFGALNRAIPAGHRVLAGLQTSPEAHQVSKHFKSRDIVLSPSCRTFLESDVQYVRGAVSERLDAKDFYRGLNPGWSAVEQNLDAPRKLTDSILTDVILADSGERPDRLEAVIIKGHAGSGKSVVLRRLAWDAAHDYNALVLMQRPQGVLSIGPLRELLAATEERIYLFIDDAADRAREIATLARDIGPEGRRLSLLMAERINEWNVSGGPVEALLTSEYVIPYLDGDEIESLIGLLTRHRALGTLESASSPERVAAFEQRAGRQLLVALHEATLSKPFEDIIKDEFDSIVPVEAQTMYLSVCVLNRLNVPVRAGLVARMHDLPFDYFEKRFFKPLEHVVQVGYDSILRDHTYAARHPQIAEMVFQRVLSSAELRLDKYLRCLQALNLSYSTDERAFRQMVRGRVIDELFPSAEMARQVFKAARDAAGDDTYLLQQMALYEMNSASGSLARANDLLDKALAAAPHDSTIKHSKAELLLRLADQARTGIERDQRLRDALRIATTLKDDRRNDSSHAYHTISKIALKRLQGLLEQDDGAGDDALSAAIRSAEESVSEGLQRFPDDSYLLSSEASLATLLKDSPRALAAMRTAFKTNPRNGYIASRLAKSLEEAGDLAGAKSTLGTALDSNPGDRKLHFSLAKLLFAHEGDAADKLEYHLQRSFTDGDRNYDARLLYARQLYVKGDVSAAKAMFRQLGAARLPLEIRDKPRFPMAESASGRVVRLEATYGFVARDGLADWVFMHRRDAGEDAWRRLKVGSRLQFVIAFTMKGAVAQDVAVESA